MVPKMPLFWHKVVPHTILFNCMAPNHFHFTKFKFIVPFYALVKKFCLSVVIGHVIPDFHPTMRPKFDHIHLSYKA